MDYDEPIEGEAVEVTEGGRTQPGAVELVRTAGVIRPLDVQEVKAEMDRYQAGLQSLLNASDWQNTGDGDLVRAVGRTDPRAGRARRRR